jgi:hypothetical protein
MLSQADVIIFRFAGGAEAKADTLSRDGWITRRVLSHVRPDFSWACVDGENTGGGERREREMIVTAGLGSALEMIGSGVVFGPLKIRFNLPATAAERRVSAGLLMSIMPILAPAFPPASHVNTLRRKAPVSPAWSIPGSCGKPS